jgi:hypothetical protein
MINKYLAMGLGALIVLAPVAAVAQTDTTTPAASAPAPVHKGHVRRKGHTSQHRARASAHHIHKMRTAPAEAPKS